MAEKDDVFEQLEKAHRQLALKVQKQIPEFQGEHTSRLDRVCHLINSISSLQMLMNNRDDSQSQNLNPFPFSPTTQSPDFTLSITPSSKPPSTTPKSSDPTPKPNLSSVSFFEYFKDFTAIRHEEGDIHNLFLEPDEIEINTTKVNLPSLSYFEYFENFTTIRHLEGDAHNLFEEMPLRPKSNKEIMGEKSSLNHDDEAVVEKLETERSGANPSSRPMINEEMLGKQVFDRGKSYAISVKKDQSRQPLVAFSFEQNNDQASYNLNGVLAPNFSDEEVARPTGFVKDRGKHVEAIVEEPVIEPNFASAELENHNIVYPWGLRLSKDLLWPEIARKPEVEHQDCYLRITHCSGRRAMTQNRRNTNPDGECMVVWSRRVGRNCVCAELENSGNKEQFARFVKDRGKRALAGCQRLVNEHIYPEFARQNNDNYIESRSGRIKNQRRWPSVLRSRVQWCNYGEWALTSCLQIARLEDGRTKAWPHWTPKPHGCEESWSRRIGWPEIIHIMTEVTKRVQWRIVALVDSWPRRFSNKRWWSRKNNARLKSRPRWIAGERVLTWGRHFEKQGDGRTEAWSRRIPQVERRKLRDDWFRRISKDQRRIASRRRRGSKVVRYQGQWSNDNARQKNFKHRDWSRRIAIYGSQNRSGLRKELMELLILSLKNEGKFMKLSGGLGDCWARRIGEKWRLTGGNWAKAMSHRIIEGIDRRCNQIAKRCYGRSKEWSRIISRNSRVKREEQPWFSHERISKRGIWLNLVRRNCGGRSESWSRRIARSWLHHELTNLTNWILKFMTTRSEIGVRYGSNWNRADCQKIGND